MGRYVILNTLNNLFFIIILFVFGGEGGIRTLGLCLYFNRLVRHAVTILLKFGRTSGHPSTLTRPKFVFCTQHEVPVIRYRNFDAKVPVLSMPLENPHR